MFLTTAIILMGWGMTQIPALSHPTRTLASATPASQAFPDLNPAPVTPDMPQPSTPNMQAASVKRKASDIPAKADALPDSDWSRSIQDNIRKSEYNITRQDRCVIDGEPGGLQAPNRAQNLRTYFRKDGVQITGRESAHPEWNLKLRLSEWGREDQLQTISPVEPTLDKAEKNSPSNRVVYDHGTLTESYTNTENGLEQKFTLKEAPEGDGPVLIQLNLTGENVETILGEQANEKENASTRISFKSAGNTMFQCAQIKATDANGKDVPAHFEKSNTGHAVDLLVDTGNIEVVYPITLSMLYASESKWLLPTSSGLNLTFNSLVESNQTNGQLGAVACAGDVNGDGYDDVIVGAHWYDNGQIDEGAAFLFFGSPSGLVGKDPSTCAAILESNQDDTEFGCSVSGAGDVNGDGYSDVIIGADHYDNGEINEGAAFLFLGSPSGLIGRDPSDCAVLLESNQESSYFGCSISEADDVNGDGYADVIVGAYYYDNGETDEGAAFVFLGSPSGLLGRDPSTCSAILESNQAVASFGESVSEAGDVNGDGYADIIVGTSGYDHGELGEGSAFLFMGSVQGIVGRDPSSCAALLESNQNYVSGGWDSPPRFGNNVSGAGDVNGDGYADVIIGAPGYDNGGVDEGAVFLFLGSAMGLIGQDPSTCATILHSNQSSARFGLHISDAGDVNGDGYADISVAANYYNNGNTMNEGVAFLFLGSASGIIGHDPDSCALILESNQQSAIFNSVSSAGDVNGDGYSDVIVSASLYENGQQSEGVAFLFLGSASGLKGKDPSTCAALLESNQEFSGINSVSGVGDVNGDGYADVIIGSEDYDNGQSDEGAAFLFLGSATGLVGRDPSSCAAIIESNKSNTSFTSDVSGAGDVNGDDYADVIIGSSSYNNGELGEGAAFLFLGSPSGLLGRDPSTCAAVMESNQASAYFGSSVASAGDVNGDGYTDVIIGAYNYSHEQEKEGATFLFLGSATGLVGTNPDTCAALLESDQVRSLFGNNVSGAGDINGDGYADVIIGAEWYDNGQESEGAAFLFLGSDSGLIGHNPATCAAVLESNQASAYFGSSVANAGDVNGDGFADIIIGASAYTDYQNIVGGAAFLFLGSVDGLIGRDPLTCSAVVTSNQLGSMFGSHVSGDGDVNGDGYSDIIVGAPDFKTSADSYGAVFLFLGSASGLVGKDPATCASILSSDSTSGEFGSSVSGAGDVNGDNFADVIVGAYQYDHGQGFEGSAFLFCGNTDSLCVRPQLMKEELPIVTPGINLGSGDVRLSLFAHSSGGPHAVRLEWEIKPYGVPFNGQETGVSEWYDSGLLGYQFDEQATAIGEANGFHWRMRTQYAPLTLFDAGTPLSLKPGLALPPNPAHGRWYQPQWATVGPSDFRTSAYLPPTDPDGVEVSSGPLTTADNIVCTVSEQSTSPAIPPQQTIQYEYRWSNGSRTIIHGLTADLTDTLAASETLKHETWTCSVYAWDGLYYSHSGLYDSTPEIQNAPPEAPVLSLPLVRPDAADLVCQITASSEDPDVDELTDFLRYKFDWYVKRSGDADFALFRDGAPTPAIFSQINDNDTHPGDQWYCLVTPFDQEGPGTPATSTTARINQGPSTPEIDVTPDSAPDTAPLTCTVIVPAVDPDEDPVTYIYSWYKLPDTTTPVRVNVTPALSDLLNPTLTIPGETWRCMVLASDGCEVSPPAQDTVTILGMSTITCSVQPLSLTLGDPATVSGIISASDGSGTIVSFLSASPSDVLDPNFPTAVATGTRNFSRMFYPREASEGRSPWRIRAMWPGDSQYAEAQSDPVPFEVQKAQPALSLSLSHTSALLNLAGAEDFQITASLEAAGFPPELLTLLSGRTIRLSVADPQNQTLQNPLEATTSEEGAAIFDKEAFTTAGILFDQTGRWKFKAEFPGDDNFKLTATPDFDALTSCLTIKEGSGYAILVLGRLDEAAEGHAAHAITTEYAYDTLIARNFDPEDIYYLREYLPGEEDRGIADAAATKENFQYAIETWAKNAMLASPAPLYIIMAGHGSVNKFHLDIGGTPEQEYLSAAELGDSLNLLQISLSGKEVSASDQEIVVLYGACHSGSFIPALTGENRVIITSCTGEEVSFRGVDTTPEDESAVRDGEFFLMEFMRNAGAGQTLAQAFEAASESTFDYTAPASGGEPAQHPLLEDNADGIGSTSPLSAGSGEDGYIAQYLDLGSGSNAGNSISWFTVSPPLFLSVGGQIGSLIAETTGRAVEETDKAWIEIKTPTYSDEPAAPGYEAYQLAAVMAGPILPSGSEIIGEDKYRFSWDQAALEATPSFPGFTIPGTYRVYYFLKDGNTGQVSAYLVTNIYVSKEEGQNNPPAPVTLLFPENGVTTNTATAFHWSPSSDPDGDSVTYRIELATDAGFTEDLIIKDAIAETFSQVEGLVDGWTYFWRVIPVDPYGASPTENPVHIVTFDNTNSPLTASLFCKVIDAGASGHPVITNASISLSPSGLTVSQNYSGVYAFPSVPGGPCTISATAPGYEEYSVNATLINGQMLNLELPMQPLGGEDEGEGEGSGEGEPEGGAAEGETGSYTADQDHNGQISLSELLRVIQFYNADAIHCDAASEDGYAPYPGDTTCDPYDTDYNPQDWTLSLSELLRVIQFYNAGAYHPCEGSEDGFCLG